MKNFFLLVATVLVFLINESLFPQIYFGFQIAILINLFISQRLSYFYIIVLGLLYDLFLYRYFGISLALFSLLVLKMVEQIIVYRKKAQNDFIDFLLAVSILTFVISGGLLVNFNLASLKMLLWIYMGNILAAGLIYGAWLKLEKLFKRKVVKWELKV